ncbi:hypothetical protein ACHAXA_005644 [Cyclostephanos tholiformis]|uniref:SPRY domain-containing protein n=1 Tax=Cyclostephanos tholiformis TaxID=382380 RepID=A0ABD3RDS2_9STRA
MGGVASSNKSNVPPPTHGISRAMSSPTIRIRGGGREVSGYGLALGMVPVEQDAAYWEWHVAMPPGTKRRSSHDDAREMEEDVVDDDDDDDDDGESFHDVGVDDDDDDPYALKFGVATRKDRAFYVNLENGDDGGDRESDDRVVDDGTALMRPISDLRHGDVIGVAVQQSDLPMIQILHNGEPLSRCTISRFRGTVYPAVYIPPGGGYGGRDEGGGRGDCTPGRDSRTSMTTMTVVVVMAAGRRRAVPPFRYTRNSTRRISGR